jgi:exodeoxyribonuclease V beta subunit
MKVPEFHLVDEPLECGTTLLEASAGTGKTYTLAGLYLRLILEHDLTPAQILVTTYTVPATAELRTRIRKLLREALECCNAREIEEPFLAGLFASGHVSPETARPRLEAALRSCDEAAIYTIHGFCQRMLQDRAFESGVLFDTELVTDQQAILREVAEDYWRTHFYGAPPELTASALIAGLSSSTLAKLLSDTVQHPVLTIRPDSSAAAAAREEILQIFGKLRAAWPQWRADVHRLLVLENKWGVKDCRGKLLAEQLALAEACLSDPSAQRKSYAAFDSFTPECLAKNTSRRSGHTAPQHEFFTLCGTLAEAHLQLCGSLQAEFLTWARAELPRRKAQRNVVSFDDLVTQLASALAGRGGESLAALIRSRFRAALVDEFQDTDAQQDAIFRRIFATETHWLFLIGDPKQAIYGFRGADVFAYLQASAGARRFQLGKNFRSTTPLVQAVNHLFSRRGNPFVLDAIDFAPVQSAGQADRRAISESGSTPAPFRCWRWTEEKKLTISKANEQLPVIVAAEIARMLSGSHIAGKLPLEPRNLAVLVAKNREARAVQAALMARGIPAVLLSNATVLESAEATELHTLLSSIAEPTRDRLLRIALATPILGLNAAEIERLSAAERDWEEWLLRIQHYEVVWRTVGFIQMFRQLCQRERVRSRLLQHPDGERRLTNLLHLSELLHSAACEHRLDPAGLVQWLGEQMRGSSANEEHELRLERDETAVHVVTIHKSKGLEYDVVFCPFSWGKAELRKNEPPLFHDAAAEGALTLDLGSGEADSGEAAAELERLAEQMRLLYVALTRARLQTHFVWGQFSGCEVSAANWLLNGPDNTDVDPVGALREHIKSLGAEAWSRQLQTLAAEVPEGIAVVDLPSAEAPQYMPSRTETEPLHERRFRGRIDSQWRISSFTALTAAAQDAEQPDFDRVDSAARPELPLTGIHAFPRGMKAGICLHEIFEELDFTDAAAVDPLVAQKLAAFSFDSAEHREAVAGMVRASLTTELEPGLTLSRVEQSRRFNELEFYFPFDELQAAQLTELFSKAPAGIGRVQFEPQEGFIKGFIDLVFEHDGRFYIVDWKSNWLGTDAAAYTAEAVGAEMVRHHYVLQYHLYVLALHRFLALRQPGYRYSEHFGGVFYLFLRGVKPQQPAHGIYHDRPAETLVQKLDRLFRGGAHR